MIREQIVKLIEKRNPGLPVERDDKNARAATWAMWKSSNHPSGNSSQTAHIGAMVMSHSNNVVKK
jgi:hypothetical protein